MEVIGSRSSRLEKFSRIVSAGIMVLGAASAATAAGVGVYEILGWRNSMVGSSGFLSWMIPLIPEGKRILDASIMGLVGGAAGAAGGLVLGDKAEKAITRVIRRKSNP